MFEGDPGHAPFLDFCLFILEILSTCIRVPNFKSVAWLYLDSAQLNSTQANSAQLIPAQLISAQLITTGV